MEKGMRSKRLNEINDIKIRLIFACTPEGGIGLNGDMPWGKALKSDLARFKELTMGNTVVMGYKTYKSIGRPLAGRNNVVLSRDYDTFYDFSVSVLDQSMSPYSIIRKIFEQSNGSVKNIDIIGGANVFAKFAPYAHEAVVTIVRKTDGTKIESDTFIALDVMDKFFDVKEVDENVTGENGYITNTTTFTNSKRQLPYTPVTQSIDVELLADVVTMLRKYQDLSQQVYENAIKEEKYGIVSAAIQQGLQENRKQVQEIITEINTHKGNLL